MRKGTIIAKPVRLGRPKEEGCMKRGRISRSVAALVLAGGMSLPATYAPAAEDMDMAQKVQSAKTPADHEAIHIAKWNVAKSRKNPGSKQALVTGDRRGLYGEGGEAHPLRCPPPDCQ